MTGDLTQQLDHIEQKVRQLLEALETLHREKAALTEENNNLKTNLATQNERVEELTQRLSNAQRALAQQRGDEPESSQNLRKQIDQYIHEIDKCIEWLQSV
jgi:predicted  nucleic acid-binding Zn-ribbon protein